MAELSDKVLLHEDTKRGMKFYGYKTLRTASIQAFAKEKGISEEDVYNKYADRIFQTTNAQSSIRTRVMDYRAEEGIEEDLISIEYVPTFVLSFIAVLSVGSIGNKLDRLIVCSLSDTKDILPTLIVLLEPVLV